MATGQSIRFATARDGVRIAYATSGSGPPLIKAANWLSHLEFDWDSPVWRHWLRDLSARRTLIRYDERGCGLSDREVADLSFQSWVSDLETVADTVGLPCFPLLGVSQGAAVAIAYAARNPWRRASDLIKDMTMAVGLFARLMSRFWISGTWSSGTARSMKASKSGTVNAA